MSQRLIRKHPITGACVAPIWFDQNGIGVYPIMGADSDGDDGEDGKDGDADSEGQGGDGDNGKGKETDEDLEAVKRRMQAADRRAAEAEKKVKEYEDKDKDEVTKATERAKELETQVAERDEQIKDLSMQVAFLSSNDIDWHDKDVALSHADLSEVLEEDGSVNKKALKKALENLSKEKPFLVKAKDDTHKDDVPNGATGAPAGSGGTKKDKGLTDEELKRKYPALYA
jgi:hypothetical protein